MPELNAKLIIELALSRMAALSEVPLRELYHFKMARLNRIAAHYARALEACNSLNNVFLKERIMQFACLANDPELETEAMDSIRLELELFIAQLQGMSPAEYADWEQSLREQQLCIPGINAFC